ncbi:MAG: head GIN domain-containing protein [Bacteroidota bacterium]
MKNLKLFVLVLLAGFGLTGCIIDIDGDGIGSCIRANGPTVTEVLDIAQFDGIDLQIPADVFITQGPNFEVRVEGQENAVEQLDRDVRNGFWEIEFDRCMRNLDDFRVYITMPDITELYVSGSGVIIGENIFVTGDLTLSVSGSGSIDVGLDSDDIDTRISGSGDIRMEGLADEVRHRTSGSGDLFAFDLETRTSDITISGSGDAEVFVQDELTIRISGSGDVFYKGRPSLNVSVSGSGRVIDAN